MSEAWKTDPEAAYEEAARRVAALIKERGAKDLTLDLSDLRALDRLPEQLPKIRSPISIDISRTRVRKIGEVDGLKSINSFSARDSELEDISSLAFVPSVRFIYISGSNVRDLTPLPQIRNLSAVDLDDLPAGVDFSPLGECLNLSIDASVGFISSFDERAASDVVWSEIISRSVDSERTILAVNYWRKRKGLDLFWPSDYKGPRDIDWPKWEGEDTAPRPLPGPHRFEIKGGRLEAIPVAGTPIDARLALQMLEALREDVGHAIHACQENLSDPALLSALDRLLSDLAFQPDELQLGRVQIGFRRVQALSVSYSDASAEADKTLRGLLVGLVEGLSDFIALYPAMREMEASRIALGVVQADEADHVADALEAISAGLTETPFVGGSVLSAMTDGRTEVRALADLTARSSSVQVRANAISRRGELLGQQLLNVWNLTTTVLWRIGGELGELGGDSWKAFKRGVPAGIEEGAKEATSGIVNVGLVGIAHMIAGPIGAIAVAVPAFAPLIGRLQRVEAKRVEPASASDDLSTGE